MVYIYSATVNSMKPARMQLTSNHSDWFCAFQTCVTGHVWKLRLRLAHFAVATVRQFLRHMAQHKLILCCSMWGSWILSRPYTNFLALCWSHHKYVLHVLFCFVCCLFERFIHFVDFLLWSCSTLHVGYGGMPRELQCGNLACPLLLLRGSAAISCLMSRCFHKDRLILLIQCNNKYHPGWLDKWVIVNEVVSYTI